MAGYRKNGPWRSYLSRGSFDGGVSIDALYPGGTRSTGTPNSSVIVDAVYEVSVTTHRDLRTDGFRRHRRYAFLTRLKYSGNNKGCRACTVTIAGVARTGGIVPPAWCSSSTRRRRAWMSNHVGGTIPPLRATPAMVTVHD